MTGSLELDILLAAAVAAGATCFYDTDTPNEVAVLGLAFVPDRTMTRQEATSILREAFA